METPIDRAGGGGFGAAGRGGTEGSLAMDKREGQAKIFLGNAKGAERDMDWKTSLASHAWSILHAALYYTLGLVLVGHCKGIPPFLPLNAMTTLRSYLSLFTSGT